MASGDARICIGVSGNPSLRMREVKVIQSRAVGRGPRILKSQAAASPALGPMVPGTAVFLHDSTEDCSLEACLSHGSASIQVPAANKGARPDLVPLAWPSMARQGAGVYGPRGLGCATQRKQCRSGPRGAGNEKHARTFHGTLDQAEEDHTRRGLARACLFLVRVQ